MKDVIFKGPYSKLKGKFYQDPNITSPIVLILYPESKDNKIPEVINSIVSMMKNNGFSVFLFNFERIENDVKVNLDQAQKKEQELFEVISVLNWLSEKYYDGKILWLFSFFSTCSTGLQVVMRRPEITDYILFSPSPKMKDFSFIIPCSSTGLIVYEENLPNSAEEIIEKLNIHFKGTGVNVSLPSQRADKFSLKLAELMQQEKKSTITLAPEAGSQRMRDIINKNLSKEQILNAVLSCVRSGWDKIKFYFIIGLPFEEDEDVLAIAELIKTINNRCREEKLRIPLITCSISVFVPKPHTPFGWHGQNSVEEIERKKALLLSKKPQIKNARLNFHCAKVSQLEAYFTRAGKKAGELIFELYKNGSYLDSWEENIDFELYYSIAKKLGIDIEKEATTTYNPYDNCPWEIIDTGINKKWLINEYEQAKAAKTTVPCETKCSNCGVCTNYKVSKILDK